MNINDVTNYILTQATTADLTAIGQAYKLRSRTIGQINSIQLRVGQSVRVARISPKSMVGQTGTIEQILKSNALVRFDSPLPFTTGRFAGMEKLRVPMSCLEVV